MPALLQSGQKNLPRRRRKPAWDDFRSSRRASYAVLVHSDHVAEVGPNAFVVGVSDREPRPGFSRSSQDLAEQMLAYIETRNQTATPFQWTYAGKVLNA
jgi:hypothetical protein